MMSTLPSSSNGRPSSSSNMRSTMLRLATRRVRLARQGRQALLLLPGRRRLRAIPLLPRLPLHDLSWIRYAVSSIRSVSNRYMVLCTLVPRWDKTSSMLRTFPDVYHGESKLHVVRCLCFVCRAARCEIRCLVASAFCSVSALLGSSMFSAPALTEFIAVSVCRPQLSLPQRLYVTVTSDSMVHVITFLRRAYSPR